MENNSGSDSVDSKIAVEPKIPANTNLSSISQQPQSSTSDMPPSVIDLESAYYDMIHEKRGLGIILNHFRFDSERYKNRNGTEVDRERLQKTLLELDFEVVTYNDLKRAEIYKKLKKAADMDHRNSDCVVVVVLSHGETGRLEARDGTYDVNEIWEPFLDSPTLVGKPKLFFIQACRGSKTDSGIRVMSNQSFLSRGDVVDSIGEQIKHFKIPHMADLLVMYSTYEGYYAWRNKDSGSAFIQALCDEFDKNGTKDDIFHLLTGVNRRVAFTFQSHVPKDMIKHEKKQMPSIVSMLTRNLYFTPHQKKTVVYHASTSLD